MRRHRFHRTLSTFLGHPRSADIAPGPLILLADALWFRFQKTSWTLYLLAVRPVAGSTATFLDPVLLSGNESARHWAEVLATLPPDLRSCVRAFVSDGFKGSKELAQAENWIFQRCHFHCLARFQAVRASRKYSLPSAAIRGAVDRGVRAALSTVDPNRLTRITQELLVLAADPACPQKIRMVVRAFCRELSSFHAYLRFPELHLPITTNTVETMARLLRRVVRPLRTPQAMLRWATAFIRLRPTITCNGARMNHQQN